MAIAMLIFMDESGDTGFKFSKTSSKFFVLIIVIFDSLSVAEEANEAVKKVRKELKLPEDFEFKFSTGTSDKVKRAFLQKLSNIFIDRISKSFVDDFDSYLKKRLNTNIAKIIGRIKHQDSRSNNLLQLADMVCGAIYRKYNRGEDKFYKIIKKREEDLWKPY